MSKKLRWKFITILAVLLLCVLGILGLVLCGIFTAIPAWVMGSGDLKKMEAGIMDPAGAGATKAGMWCGIILCVIVVVAFVLVFIGAL